MSILRNNELSLSCYSTIYELIIIRVSLYQMITMARIDV